MSALSPDRIRQFWRRTTPLDRLALGIVVLYAVVRLARFLKLLPRGARFVGLLFLLALGYFLIRFLSWSRTQLLWSLRNRLIVAYVFIAVVPMVLLLTMALLASDLIYVQLGAHLLQDDLEERSSKLASTADALAGALMNEGANGTPAADEAALGRPSVTAVLAVARINVPNIRVDLHSGEGMLRRLGGPSRNQFSGIVQTEGRLSLLSVVAHQGPSGRVVVSASVPVSTEMLDTLAPELGPIQLTLLRPATEADTGGLVLPLGEGRFVPADQFNSRRRTLHRRAHWLDLRVDGVSTLETYAVESGERQVVSIPILASFSVRPSELNHRLFTSLGAVGRFLVLELAVAGITFLILEVVALITGIVLTRTITHAVSDLYDATQHVRAGDFSHRVRLERRDQLGVLGESFNAMTSSISELIEEQRQRQRLENELSIAREVQSQLFPQSLPSLPGVQLAAICRPARVVSGDYYDFIRLGPTRLGMAIADISGKGISAALLMASLQAALRSQALLDGNASTAELVSRLNQHLFRNTSDDRYATFFYAVYDTGSQTLSYTNAGHLPPFYVIGDEVTKLVEGGTVVGLFDDCVYTQGTIRIAPGSLLVAYSDGLVEPENVYGEEFGSQRLMEEVVRHTGAPSQRIAEALMNSAEQWAGSPEQADDMTVLVARMGERTG